MTERPAGRRSKEVQRWTCFTPSRLTPPSFTFMSPNQPGKIVARVTYPRGAASDLKQKRHSTPRPQPPAEDIIEISSDEDEKAQQPLKRPSRATSSRTHNPDYNVPLSRKDREIEKLKKVPPTNRPWFFQTNLVWHRERRSLNKLSRR